MLDETGLTGEYDFKLEFRPESFVPAEKFGVPIPAPDTSEDPRPSIFTAVQQQLGLKLDARKGPVNSIVIESVEKLPVALACANELQPQFEQAQRKMSAASIEQSDVPASERQAQAIFEFARDVDA